MPSDPVIPGNSRRAEAALCRVAKAEAGTQKTTWIPGQARNDKLDHTCIAMAASLFKSNWNNKWVAEYNARSWSRR